MKIKLIIIDIFDETFDEIDIESERKILSNIKSNYNKTVIVISHRESNLDLYDKRVVMTREGGLWEN